MVTRSLNFAQRQVLGHRFLGQKDFSCIYVFLEIFRFAKLGCPIKRLFFAVLTLIGNFSKNTQMHEKSFKPKNLWPNTYLWTKFKLWDTMGNLRKTHIFHHANFSKNAYNQHRRETRKIILTSMIRNESVVKIFLKLH